MKHPHSSRQRYRTFVNDYKRRQLDDAADTNNDEKKLAESATADGDAAALETQSRRRGKRREYLREYLSWLWPQRSAVAAVFVFALFVAGLEMIEPLFMRFIIDRVLLNPELGSATRLPQLHLVGALFLAVIVLSKLSGVLKDYRQRLLNVRVMLALRRSLFDRLL